MKGNEPPEEGTKMSALCRTVKKDGWDLEIFIFEDGEGKWLLEIEDDSGTSTCWTDSFDTEQEALDEALKTIEENSIEYFHEAQPNMAFNKALQTRGNSSRAG